MGRDAVAIAIGLLAVVHAGAASLTPGNMVVYRVGDGIAAPSTANGNAVFIDEYTPAGGLVQSLAMPTSGANTLTTQSASDVGLINRSANGSCLTMTGVAVVPGSTVTGAERAVSFLLPSGALGTTSVGSTLVKLGTSPFAGDSIRASVSNDCSQVWVTGNGTSPNRGIYAVNRDGTGLAQLFSSNATQGLTIAGGQLYASIGGGSGTVSAVGSGLPSSGTPALVGFNPGPAVNTNYRAIALLDLDSGVAGVDTLYVSNNTGGKLEKYYGSGSSWTSAGAIVVPNISGLTARNIGSAAAPMVALYFTDTATNTVQVAVDRAGRTGSLAGVAKATLVAAQTNKLLRGVAWVPEATPPVAAPDAAANASASSVSSTGFRAQWTAPASGAAIAYFVVEVFDSAANVVQTLYAAPGATFVDITGLAVGSSSTFRVRAINNAGGSADLVSAPVTTFGSANAAPTVSGLTHNAPFTVTAGDSLEPLASTGLAFTVADAEDGVNGIPLAVSATSGNTTVLPNANLALTNNGNGSWTLKVATTGIANAGYADVTVKVTDSGAAVTSVVLKLAVSVRSAADVAGNTSPRWIGGRSDASDGVAIGTRYVLVGDDEPKNVINLYDRTQSGQPVKVFDISADLGVNTGSNCAGVTGSKCDGETDLEASTRKGSRTYWLGSHSNNKNGKIRPDRWRFMAYDLAGSDLGTTLTPVGYYQHLRTDLLAWDHGNTHGLGIDYLGLTASSAEGIAPESDNLDGFGFEGMETSPDDSSVWFAFRAPLVSAPGMPAVTTGSSAGRTHALIVQVSNYDALLQPTGGVAGSAAIGTPIRLDLGGRTIRDIRKNAAGQYLIIAGPPNSATGTLPKDFRLFTWDGSRDATGLATGLQLRAAALGSFTAPNFGGSAEGIVEVPANLTATSQIDIITDSGDVDFYGDGTAAKDLGDNGAGSASANVAIKKSRIDTVTLGGVISREARLSALVPSAGTLVFDGNTTSYVLTVDYSVTAISLTPTVADSGAVATVNGTLVASGSASSPVPLAVGTTSIVVVSTAADGTTRRSYTVGVTRTPLTVPGAPTQITVVPGLRQVTVYFTPPASNGGSPITSYRVTAQPESGPGLQLQAADTITATGPGSPITVTGLLDGTRYTFTVEALNIAGASPAAASVTASTDALHPVPTLSAQALALLSLALAGMGFLGMRRRG